MRLNLVQEWEVEGKIDKDGAGEGGGEGGEEGREGGRFDERRT